jgi:hypothetical protein
VRWRDVEAIRIGDGGDLERILGEFCESLSVCRGTTGVCIVEKIWRVFLEGANVCWWMFEGIHACRGDASPCKKQREEGNLFNFSLTFALITQSPVLKTKRLVSEIGLLFPIRHSLARNVC